MSVARIHAEALALAVLLTMTVAASAAMLYLLYAPLD